MTLGHTPTTARGSAFTPAWPSSFHPRLLLPAQAPLHTVCSSPPFPVPACHWEEAKPEGFARAVLGKDSSSTARGIGAGQPLRSPCAANKQISEGIFTLSPSATWQITSPVAGLIVGKVFLLTASCHSLFMKIWKEGSKAGSHLRARPRGIARSFYLFVGFSAGCLIQGAQLAGAPKPHGSGGDVLAQTEQQLPADKKDPHRGSSPLTGSFRSPGEPRAAAPRPFHPRYRGCIAPSSRCQAARGAAGTLLGHGRARGSGVGLGRACSRRAPSHGRGKGAPSPCRDTHSCRDTHL